MCYLRVAGNSFIQNIKDTQVDADFDVTSAIISFHHPWLEETEESSYCHWKVLQGEVEFTKTGSAQDS